MRVGWLVLTLCCVMGEDFSNFIDSVDPDLNMYDEINQLNLSKFYSVANFRALLDENPNFHTIVNFNIRSYFSNSDDFLPCSMNSLYPK